MIQLTLSMSLLLPLFLGTWEYGYIFYQYSQLSEAVRAGARYASLATYDSTCSTTPSGGAYPTAVANMVVYGDPTGTNTTPVVVGLTTSNVSLASVCTNNVPTSVSVSIVNFNIHTWFGNRTLNNNPYAWFPYVGTYGPP